MQVRFKKFVSRLAAPLVLGAIAVGIVAPKAHALPGDMDPAFGQNGVALTDFRARDTRDSGQLVAVQADGKIVVAGTSSPVVDLYEVPFTNTTDISLVRYNPDGSVDTTFGDNGRATPLSTTARETATAMVLQPDGKIVVAGNQTWRMSSGAVLIRLNPNGSLDTTFGVTGEISLSNTVHALLVDGDKLIVAGSTVPTGQQGATRDFQVFRLNANGSIDGSFQSSLTDLGNTYDEARALAMVNGKIVVAGTGGQTNTSLGIVRLNSNGSLDTSFGTGGKVVAATGYDITLLAIRPDGKVVTAGTVSSSSTDNDFTLTRFNADGSLDTSFGTGGRVTTDVASTEAGATRDDLRTITLDGERIVAAGYSNVAGATSYNLVLVRYSANGGLDGSFGTGGRLVEPARPGTVDALLASGGQLLAAGSMADDLSGVNLDFEATRYDANGSLDTGFGSGGHVRTNIGRYSDDGATATIVQPDGKLVVAGYAYNGRNQNLAVTRFNADGSIDTGFGAGGRVVTPISPHYDLAQALTLDGGKIIAAGSSWNGTNADIVVVRYNADGSLDNSFDGDGIVTTDIANSIDHAYGVIVTDGKIIVGGTTYLGSDGDFLLVRYNADGSLDTGFGNGGKAVASSGTNNDWAWAMTAQPDGKLILAGSTGSGAATDYCVMRFNADGTLDNSFGSGGRVVTPVGPASDYADAIAVQPDGKIVVAGTSNNGTDDDISLVRYNPDGSLEQLFGGDGTVVTAIGPGHDRAKAVAIDGGLILVAGTTFTNTPGTDTNSDMMVVCYTPGGVKNSVFGSNGIVTTDVGGWEDQANAMVIDNGTIVVAGYAWNQNSFSNEFAVVRYEGVANPSPVATSDSYTTAEDIPLTVAAPGVLSNDNDPDGSTPTAALVSGPAHGSLTLNADGSFIYTPAANYNGTDSFTYQPTDGNSLGYQATVSLTVTAVNDAPTISAIDDASVTQNGSTGALNFTVSDVDTPAVNLTVTGASGNTVLIPNAGIVLGGSGANRTVTVTPAPGRTGTAAISITVSDGSLSATETFVLTVTAPTYTVTGRVATSGGAPVAGVNVTASSPTSTAPNLSAQTNDNGEYSISGLPFGTYSITPGLAGYSFTTSGFNNPTEISDDRSGLNFIATTLAAAGSNLSGRIANHNGSPMANIVIRLSGGRQTTTDASGNYSFTGLPAGSYNVAPLITPSLSGVTFSPSLIPVTLSGANVTNQNFAAGFAISGRVANHSGAGIANVLVQRAAGGSTVGTYTDASGNYSFANVRSGAYTVAPVLTPALAGMSFTPVSRSVTIDRAALTNQSFIGQFSITGRITNHSGVGIANVLVQRKVGTSTVSTFTDTSGNYRFTNVRSGSYTIAPALTPAMSGTSFTPASRSTSVVTTNIFNQNFIAMFSVSGRITSSAGTGVANVLVRLSAGSSSTTVLTDGSGNYRFANVRSGTYSITPALSGRTFAPATRSGVVVSAVSVGNQNFTAAG